MEPTTPTTPTTPEPSTPTTPTTPEPSAPNPAPAAATPANPTDGTGANPQPLRNQPNAAPEGYVPSDKFTASQQEALRMRDILQKNGIDPKTGERIASTPTPAAAPTAPLTYEQAVAQIPGFSTLTNEEKALILNPRAAYKDISDMRRMVAEMYDERETSRQIKELKAKDGYQDLDADAFREFIYREENIGVKNLETLAKMFKQEQANVPPAKPTPEGAEPRSNGAKTISTAAGVTEMTATDAAELRRTDPRQYAKLIRNKQLRITSE